MVWPRRIRAWSKPGRCRPISGCRCASICAAWCRSRCAWSRSKCTPPGRGTARGLPTSPSSGRSDAVPQQGEHVSMTETSASWSELAARHPDIAVERLVVTSLAANCYLLTCRATGEVIVIDAGDDGPRILDRIDQVTGGARECVRLIINTHGHFDHVAAVADLRAVLGPVPVLMHPDDVELVEGNGTDVLRMLRREYVPVLPDGLLLEGDEVRWGDCALRVITTPGHSPGGICL